MGEDTSIAWCDATFNPWWGCFKISPGCKHCYAATFDKRVGGDNWKPDGPRRFFGDAHWRKPEKWNRDAEKAGVRRRVFCASMADVFEDREDLLPHRARLWSLISMTPHLDWLLLTKRPENLRAMLPWTRQHTATDTPGREPWPNVWLGTTTEDQEHADRRVPLLLGVPAVVRFLSVEPMIGPVDLAEWIERVDHCGSCEAENPPQGPDVCPECVDDNCLISTWGEAQAENYRTGERYADDGPGRDEDGPALHWIISGAESGHGARPAQVDWYRSLRDQCASAGVPFLLKQAVEQPGAAGRLHSIGVGDGSWRKGREGLIELPYLDGVQHAAWPTVETAPGREGGER